MKRSPFCLIVVFLCISSGCSHKSGGNDIKVMTLNIRYDNPGDSIYAWSTRAQQICNFIKDEKPDILGAQEVL
ncbi:MAG TPA: endonuclease, partial [Bacteroidales bacterium]